MSGNTGTRKLSPPLLIAIALALGVGVGLAAFGGGPGDERPGSVEPAMTTLDNGAVEDTAREPGSVAEASRTPGTAGMQVALDPETGEFTMPTAVQRRGLSPDLERDLSYSDEGLQVVYRADGSRHVNLEGRFQNFSVAHIREDGSLEFQCVQGEGAAHRCLDAGPPSSGEALPEE